ncbi:MAG: hypothetical protein ACRYHA_03835 [Janthinobacterium lividum]
MDGKRMGGDPALPGMAVSPMLSMPEDMPPAAEPMDSDKDRLCPFSAAFPSVIASVAFRVLFTGFAIANRSWSVAKLRHGSDMFLTAGLAPAHPPPSLDLQRMNSLV